MQVPCDHSWPVLNKFIHPSLIRLPIHLSIHSLIHSSKPDTKCQLCRKYQGNPLLDGGAITLQKEVQTPGTYETHNAVGGADIRQHMQIDMYVCIMVGIGEMSYRSREMLFNLPIQVAPAPCPGGSGIELGHEGRVNVQWESHPRRRTNEQGAQCINR